MRLGKRAAGIVRNLAAGGILLLSAGHAAHAAGRAADVVSVAPNGNGAYRVIVVGSGEPGKASAELAMLYQAAIKTLADGKPYFRLVRADFRNRPDRSGRPTQIVVGEIQTYADRQPGPIRLFDAREVFARLGRRLAG